MVGAQTDRELAGKFLIEVGTPLAHRVGVIAVDPVQPAAPTAGDPTTGVDVGQARNCRFDVDLTAVGLTSITVSILFRNSRTSEWFRGESVTWDVSDLTAGVGRFALEVPEARDATVFLAVTAFAGVSFILDADFIVS
jgi:hypothetical protein